MTRSRFETRMFFANHPFIALLCVVAILMLVTAGVATAARQVFGSSSPMLPFSETTTTPTSLSSPSPDDEHDETGFSYDDRASCENEFATEELATFLTSVMDYEQAYQSPPSVERSDGLKAVTTSDYQKSHAETGIETGSDVIVTLLRDKTTILCTVNDDGSVRASSHIVIQTSFINSAGEVEIIYPALNVPTPHVSTWVDGTGDWKVDTEE